jgi:putative transposase
MSRTALCITLSPCERELLLKIQRKHSVPEFLKQRLQIVLAAHDGLRNQDIAQQYNLEVNRVGTWRKRWAIAHRQWQQSDTNLRPAMSEKLVLLWLADKARSGRKPDFTTDQRAKIAGLCLKSPEQNGIPVTHWTVDFLAEAAVKLGIVKTISRVTVHRILKKTTCRPIGADTGSMPK